MKFKIQDNLGLRAWSHAARRSVRSIYIVLFYKIAETGRRQKFAAAAGDQSRKHSHILSSADKHPGPELLLLLIHVRSDRCKVQPPKPTGFDGSVVRFRVRRGTSLAIHRSEDGSISVAAETGWSFLRARLQYCCLIRRFPLLDLRGGNKRVSPSSR